MMIKAVILFSLVGLLISKVFSFTVVTHTVWVPAGHLIALPCKLNATVVEKDPIKWVQLNKNLLLNLSTATLIAWYNSAGELLHIGDVMLIKLVPFASGEVGITQYVPDKHSPGSYEDRELDPPNNINLIPEYIPEKGGTSQLFQLNGIDTITCNILKSPSVLGNQDPFFFPDRATEQIFQVQFKLMPYAPPLVVWSYAIPPPFTNPLSMYLIDSQALLDAIDEWCKNLRNVTTYTDTICKDRFTQMMPHRPTIKQSSESIPLLLNTEQSYMEITIVIELSTSPLHLLANPFQGQLSYIHARAKLGLDYTLISFIREQMEAVDEFVIGTRVQAICASGSQVHLQVPKLKPLEYNEANLWNLTEEELDEPGFFSSTSAAALHNWPIVCHACPVGFAPLAPYSYGGCYPCPQGYYRGETGWPSAAGCLKCPDGFTTEHIGSTNVRECELEAGALTKGLVAHMLTFWYIIETAMIGGVYGETETRVVEEDKRTPWSWLGRTGIVTWIVISLYLMLTFWLATLAMFRLQIYHRLKRVYKKQLKLLLKLILLGQINLVTKIKQNAEENTVEPAESEEEEDDDDDDEAEGGERADKSKPPQPHVDSFQIRG